MAELILTEKEKADGSYLDWDDDALGKLVKKTALMMKDEYGQLPTYAVTCCHVLIGMAADVNAETSTYTLNGITNGDESLGDWKVTVEKVSS